MAFNNSWYPWDLGKKNLYSLCHKKLRSWLELPINGTLDTFQLPNSKLGLNIIDISTKYVQCHVKTHKNFRHQKTSTLNTPTNLQSMVQT